MSLQPKLHPGIVGIVLVLSAAVLLAACSSSSSTSSTTAATTGTSTSTAAPSSSSMGASTTTSAATANFDSCSVVTQSEVAAAFDQSVTAGVLGTATVEGGLACVFYGPSSPTPTTPNAAQPDTVRVVVVKGTDASTWYNNYKSLMAARAQPVAGYGDQAFYDGSASLSILKGDSYLRVAVAPAGAPPSLFAEEQIATAILPKL